MSDPNIESKNPVTIQPNPLDDAYTSKNRNRPGEYGTQSRSDYGSPIETDPNCVESKFKNGEITVKQMICNPDSSYGRHSCQ